MMTDYEEKCMEEIRLNAERRKNHQEEMKAERARVIRLFQRRGIPRAPRGCHTRVVMIESVYDGIHYEQDYFQIPSDIDLECVVRWFVHDTKFGECTVFQDGLPYTTIRDDYNIDYYFRYARKAGLA